MKKSYVKPQVLFEDFQLSTNIAGNCGDYFKGNNNVTAKDINNCGYRFADETVFLTTSGGCDRGPQDDDLFKICYQNPSEEQMIFAS